MVARPIMLADLMMGVVSVLCLKKLSISTTLKTGTAPGNTNAHIVPKRFRLFTVIKFGIKPPLINIVRKKNHVYAVRL